MTQGVSGGTSSAPPGWYPVAGGRLWWWDGNRWHEPPRQPGVDRSMAVVPHLGFFMMPVFVALGFRLTLGKKDAFIRHHATEALNLQIWFAILWNGVGVSWFAYVIATGEWQDGLLIAW